MSNNEQPRLLQCIRAARSVAAFHGGSLRQLISAILALLLVRADILAQPAAGLQLIALQGSGVTHLVGNRRTEVPVVSIRDANNRPVEGASVTFVVPSTGPSGTFGKDKRELTVVTKVNGVAEAKGFRPNGVLGEYVIRVTASHSGSAGTLELKQTNAAAPTAAASRKSRGKMMAVYILAIGVGSLVLTLVALKDLNKAKK